DTPEHATIGPPIGHEEPEDVTVELHASGQVADSQAGFERAQAKGFPLLTPALECRRAAARAAGGRLPSRPCRRGGSLRTARFAGSHSSLLDLRFRCFR